MVFLMFVFALLNPLSSCFLSRLPNFTDALLHSTLNEQLWFNAPYGGAAQRKTLGYSKLQHMEDCERTPQRSQLWCQFSS
jgi:hypothetical protein